MFYGVQLPHVWHFTHGQACERCATRWGRVMLLFIAVHCDARTSFSLEPDRRLTKDESKGFYYYYILFSQ